MNCIVALCTASSRFVCRELHRRALFFANCVGAFCFSRSCRILGFANCVAAFCFSRTALPRSVFRELRCRILFFANCVAAFSFARAALSCCWDAYSGLQVRTRNPRVRTRSTEYRVQGFKYLDSGNLRVKVRIEELRRLPMEGSLDVQNATFSSQCRPSPELFFFF